MDTKEKKGLSIPQIVCLVVAVFIAISLVMYGANYIFVPDFIPSEKKLDDKKTEYEISKLDAEISRIRSEMAGSLFWLKLIAIFVTVGGAVGGFLIGQSRTTKEKLAFESRKNVDEVYQSIVQELSDDKSPVLRAAAAVKLGAILKSFPAEWRVGDDRKKQIIELTKQVLAAALSIEEDRKVLKTLTINIILHKAETGDELASVQGLDLSGAKATDAYWARCDFEYADFYNAQVDKGSFRKSNLSKVQFREAFLENAVFDDSICNHTNFKMADLRGASFDGATLTSVNFEHAKVHGISMKGASIVDIEKCQVDKSEAGDGSQMVTVSEWLKGIRQ